MHFIHTSWRKFCAVFLVILSVGLSVCYVTAEKVKMFKNFSDKEPPPRSQRNTQGRTAGVLPQGRAGAALERVRMEFTGDSRKLCGLLSHSWSTFAWLWKIRKAMAGGTWDTLVDTEPINITCYTEDSWRSDPGSPRQPAIPGGGWMCS